MLKNYFLWLKNIYGEHESEFRSRMEEYHAVNEFDVDAVLYQELK